MKVHLTTLCLIIACLQARGQWVETVAGVLETPGFNDGPALSSRFFSPHGIAVDGQGNVYVADRYNHTIRKYDPVSKTVTTLAGQHGQSGSADGQGTNARFNEPWGLCATANGTLYVADTKNNKIRKVTPDGVVSTVAGTGNYGTSDGAALASTFGNPTGIEVDQAGNIYVADHLTHIIRKISTNGTVTTLAGTPYIPGDQDGAGSQAQFWRPYGLTLDNDGNIIVADEWNHKIRKVTPSGVVSTVAGTGDVGLINGAAASAAFNYPWDVTVDPEGNIYVADGYNYVIRKITPTGQVSSLAGTPQTSGGVDGPAQLASFSGATAVAWEYDQGTIYVGDAYNHLVRRIIFDDAPPASVTLVNLSGTTQLCEGDFLQVEAQPTSYSAYRFFLDGALVQDNGSASASIGNLDVGNHDLYVEAISGTDTLESNSIQFTVAAVPQTSISVVGELSFYEGDSVILVASGVGEFLWSNGATTQTITVYSAGTYSVQLTQNGCTGISEPVVVEVIPLPDEVTIIADGDNILCPGEVITLTSSLPDSNQWLKDGWEIPGATAQTLEVTEPGSYQVRRVDNGITAFSNIIDISEAPAVSLDIGATPVRAVPGTAVTFEVLTESNLSAYAWDFGDPDSGEANFSAAAAPVHIYENEGTYTVSLRATDTYQCEHAVTKPSLVHIAENPVVPVGGELFLPTAFSPNGDGVNDLFRLRGTLPEDLLITIYNQWGEVLYQSENPDFAWDGTRKGLPVHSGTYTYVLEIRNGNSTQLQSGHVTLLR
ncbi:MAG: hypothetical protein CMN32_03875 [Saprospirales bacterium]|nr:hypothetical protein [Saprospirales bacterium]